MRITKGSTGWRTVVITCMGLVASTGCHDETPTRGITPERASAAADASITDSTDFFAADVRIKSTGRHAGAKLPVQGREFSYHMERTLAGKSWKTSMTIPVNGMGPVRAGATDVARIDIDEDTHSAKMYGRDGAEIAMPDVDDPRVGAMTRAFGNDSAYQNLRSAGKGKGKALGRDQSSPRAWLDNLVVPATEEQRGRRIGQLERHFGKAKGKVKGLDRYLKDNGHHVVEVLVDPAAGTVAETNMAEDGQLKQHTVYGYADLPNGKGRIRASTHVEIAPRDGAGEPTTIDYSLSNVRLERRGVTP